MQKNHVKNKYFVLTELYFALISIKPKKRVLIKNVLESIIINQARM